MEENKYPINNTSRYIQTFLKYANHQDFKALRINEVDDINKLTEQEYKKLSELVNKRKSHSIIRSIQRYDGISLIEYITLKQRKSILERLTEIEVNHTLLNNDEIDKAIEMCDFIKMKLQEAKLTKKERDINKLTKDIQMIEELKKQKLIETEKLKQL